MPESYAGFDYWHHGAPILFSGRSLEFAVWHDGAPVISLAGEALRLVCTIPNDWSGNLDLKTKVPVEFVLALNSLLEQLPIESSGIWQRLDAIMPVEWRGTVDVVQKLPMEWVATLDERYGINADSTLTVSARCVFPMEWTGQPTLLSKLPFEFSSVVVYVTPDYTIPFDFSASIADDHTLRIEWKATVTSSKQTLPEDFVAVLRTLQEAPLEWLSTMSIKATPSVEWSGYTSVGSLLGSIPFESSTQFTIQIDDTAPVEWTGFDPMELWIKWNHIFKLNQEFRLQWQLENTALGGINFPMTWRITRSLPTFEMQWNIVPSQLLITDSDIQKPVASGDKIL